MEEQRAKPEREREQRHARALSLARIGMRTSEHTCAWYRTSGQWTSIRLRYTRSRCTMHKGGVGEEGAGRLGGMGVARARERGARVLSRGNGGASAASAAATATAGTRVEMRSGTAAETVVAQPASRTHGRSSRLTRRQTTRAAGRRGRQARETRRRATSSEWRRRGKKDRRARLRTRASPPVRYPPSALCLRRRLHCLLCCCCSLPPRCVARRGRWCRRRAASSSLCAWSSPPCLTRCRRRLFAVAALHLQPPEPSSASVVTPSFPLSRPHCSIGIRASERTLAACSPARSS